MNKKECKTCRYGETLYVGMTKYANWENLCYCALKEEMQKLNFVCAQWEKRQKPEYDYSAARFNEAEEDVNYLIKHLKESRKQHGIIMYKK